jgi:hypothetical protein
MAKRPHDAIRIEPISIGFGTGLNLGGAMGTTAHGGAVNMGPNVGDFTVLVGAHLGSTASAIGGGYGTGVAAILFTVYESTAATHAGSAISGATLKLGAATAGTLRGLYDCVIAVTSNLTTTENITINGYAYHTTLTGPGQDGSAVAAELCAKINGRSTVQNKLPHYSATCTTLGVWAGTSGLVFIYPDDDQATGLTIAMDAAGSTILPGMNRLQGKISINAHALSTNRPKWINVTNSTYPGTTGTVYAFMMRGGATPGALVSINT